MMSIHFSVNSQTMREVLHEITNDTSLTVTQLRDHNYVLLELARRLKERYGINIDTIRINPRDTTHISIEALCRDSDIAFININHFADTLRIAKRKHYASWTISI